MKHLDSVQIKAFVPAKDFELSKKYYQDIGFELVSNAFDVAFFRHGDNCFLLQDFYVQSHAENCMMHLQVKDVYAWHEHLKSLDIEKKYNIKIEPPVVQPWGMVDFTLKDPSGVLWRIAQNVADVKPIGLVGM